MNLADKQAAMRRRQKSDSPRYKHDVKPRLPIPRGISLECLVDQHFLSCPDLKCKCKCHVEDGEVQ